MDQELVQPKYEYGCVCVRVVVASVDQAEPHLRDGMGCGWLILEYARIWNDGKKMSAHKVV